MIDLSLIVIFSKIDNRFAPRLQMINFNKSKLFFSPNTTEDLRSIFIEALNVQTSDAIETYLGLPMMKGKSKKVLFRSIKDRIWVRLHSWQPNLFSQAGKEVLLKAVIQVMPTYFICCFRIPEGQCQEFEKLMARYRRGQWNQKKDSLESVEGYHCTKK